MKPYHFIFFTVFSLAAKGQNLIPNPGFDVITSCPDSFNQIYLANPWKSASNNTPDLFNECSTGVFLSVPNAGHYIDGYQNPKSGKGYAGVFAFFDFPHEEGISEYIETPLISHLVKDKCYYIKFYVSPAISPAMIDWIYTDAIGLALTDTFYYVELASNIPAPLTPAIENRGQVIKDTVGWTKVSGCYVAKGGEKYAIIGNFRNEQETLVERGGGTPTWPSRSYFYIEDVLIQAFDPLPDTLLLCDGTSETLNAGFLDAKYLWNTGETDSILHVSVPGIYTVEAFIDDCVLRDTVTVLDTRDMESFQADTVICADEPLKLAAPLPGSYLWSDGSNGRELTVGSTGEYSVTITNDCGQFSFSTQVEARDCACRVYVPTAISPNGDGINDELRAFFGCDYEYRILRFAVFDRWGGQAYCSNEGQEPLWDGNTRGKPVAPGLYVWYLEYEVIGSGTKERHIKKGEMSLIR